MRFRWLDAAFDVPMTRYAPDRKEHFYFCSLAGLGKVQSEMEVVVHLPEGTQGIQTLVPEPQSRESSVLRFRLPQDRVAIVNAKHPQLNTRWLTATYRRMTVHIPDTPFTAAGCRSTWRCSCVFMSASGRSWVATNWRRHCSSP